MTGQCASRRTSSPARQPAGSRRPGKARRTWATGRRQPQGLQHWGLAHALAPGPMRRHARHARALALATRARHGPPGARDVRGSARTRPARARGCSTAGRPSRAPWRGTASNPRARCRHSHAKGARVKEEEQVDRGDGEASGVRTGEAWHQFTGRGLQRSADTTFCVTFRWPAAFRPSTPLLLRPSRPRGPEEGEPLRSSFCVRSSPPSWRSPSRRGRGAYTCAIARALRQSGWRVEGCQSAVRPASGASRWALLHRAARRTPCQPRAGRCARGTLPGRPCARRRLCPGVSALRPAVRRRHTRVATATPTDAGWARAGRARAASGCAAPEPAAQPGAQLAQALGFHRPPKRLLLPLARRCAALQAAFRRCAGR